MRAFADLLDRLILTPSRAAKLRIAADYFATTPDPDRGWALAALTGALSFRAAKPAMLRALAASRVDAVLFELSYDYVGDLAETIALIWPARPGANREPSLSEVVDALTLVERAAAPALLERLLDALDASARWALIKLVTGGLRIGVSARLAKQAVADFGGKDVADIEAIWHGLEAPYTDLFAWCEGRADKPAPSAPAPFRPVMLAHALEDADREKLDAAHYAAEWKWDGVRVQAASEDGTRRLYTRTGDDISHAFPDVLAAMDFEGALDGELLVRGPDGRPAAFNALQQRLNRKTVTKKMLAEHPAFIRVYDLLVEGGDDLRPLSFRDRRARLERFVATLDANRFDLSPLVAETSWDALDALRAEPREPSAEGLMLKRWDAPYHAGRPKGPWFKWKRDPFVVDAVLMYAQRGHGKRSGLYSDYTFGVWREGELAPVGKAYFGFTDAELKEIDAFVRAHTIDRFGPVRQVEPTLVLEIAFEGLQRSPRHKSGVAMRFPRVSRIRWDKPAGEADTLESLARLLPD